jgi:glycosyltransferase involved in cell wall biosynthesis
LNGTPVVANDVGALSEVVGSCGIVSDISTPEKLANVLNNISIDDISMWRSKIKQRDFSGFSFDRFGASIWEVYND